MGSFIEINDTLQITKEQGFPDALSLEQHKTKPFTADDFKNRIFSFSGKQDIRFYHSPPVRCFFAENTGSDWHYWGHIHMLSITHDYMKRETSGTYKIVKIFSLDEMKAARDILGVKKVGE